LNRAVTQVVRKFGLAGGMESYVWHLTHGLAERGVSVNVVCEDVIHQPCSPLIKIYQVAPSPPSRSRWRSMLIFRLNVEALLGELGLKGSIIHSHERSVSHHVTTLHGPSIFDRSYPKISRYLSPRIRAWEHMESQEIFGKHVRCVLGVSDQVVADLSRFHPPISNKILMTACPGVIAPILNDEDIRESDAFRFIFVGREWKRKGLLFAIEVVREFVNQSGVVSVLDVFGPTADSLPRSIRNNRMVSVKGWVKTIPYEKYDALIHPALTEPFGMIVAEARAHGLPVLASERTGARCLGWNGAWFNSLEDHPSFWAKTLLNLVEHRSLREPEVIWTWDNLVNLHLTEIYPHI
jgi:UDP-glucose:(heptosyl)LPS alpha-1,3-glucosyltransferase